LRGYNNGSRQEGEGDATPLFVSELMVCLT